MLLIIIWLPGLQKNVYQVSATLFVFFFRILLFTLPFMAVVYGFASHATDPELAFTTLFVKALPPWMLIFVVLFD